MGLFNFGKKGGFFADVIRCDEEDYLVWKWRPEGSEADSSGRENSIRWGSQLRVKDGEVAVFVYKQKGGSNQDFIEGPFDETLKTANFPVLSNIMGALFDGKTPFQAEVYFINLAGVIKQNFGVPYFDVADSRPDLAYLPVPVAANGNIIYQITDYKAFIKLHRLQEFTLEKFKDEVKNTIITNFRGIVTNVPQQFNIPLVQIDRATLEVNDFVSNRLKGIFDDVFGVNLKRIDFVLNVDKDSANYKTLYKMTVEQQMKMTEAQTNVNVKNLSEMQAINAENVKESLRIQREEAQRAQKMQTESANIFAHQINVQGGVAKEAASHIGEIGAGATMPLGGGDATGGMNMAGMMTGMMVGGAMGRGVADMMNNTMSGFANPMGNAGMASQMGGMPPVQPTMNPPQMNADDNIVMHVSQNGQQFGPYKVSDIKNYISSGNINSSALVWTNGMSEWTPIANYPAFSNLFGGSVPPPPPPPPMS